MLAADQLQELIKQIDHYKIAVETLRDRKQPETFEIVDRALRSLTELSKRFRRGASSTELDEFVAEELEEFEIEGDEPDEPPLVDDQI